MNDRPPHHVRIACLGLALSLLVLSTKAPALPMPLDDSGTVVLSGTIPMMWSTPTPRGTSATLLSGSTAIRVRLNVTAWVHRSGRIYLVLPAQSPGTIRAAWSTHGQLIPGEVRSGNRALVFSGPITAAFLEDTLQMTIYVDGRQLHGLQDIDFRFELEPT